MIVFDVVQLKSYCEQPYKQLFRLIVRQWDLHKTECLLELNLSEPELMSLRSCVKSFKPWTDTVRFTIPSATKERA